jgi:hypothetical protein
MYILQDVKFWAPYFASMSQTIARKLESTYHIDLPPGDFRVFGFYDCTVIGTARPAGGPSDGGPNAPRHSRHIQRAFYNGWKKKHGIKYLSFELPNGICMGLYGPMSFRHSDLDLLVDSNLNNIINAAVATIPNNTIDYAGYATAFFRGICFIAGACSLKRLFDIFKYFVQKFYSKPKISNYPIEKSHNYDFAHTL